MIGGFGQFLRGMTTMSRNLIVLQTTLLSFAMTMTVCANEFELSRNERGVTVKLNGKLFTEYLVKSGTKPVLWPLIGPTGHEMTRNHPMKTGYPNERADHPHHRSVWFTHGDVNGISFWHEEKRSGIIAHKKFLKVGGGKHGVIATQNDWLSEDGNKQCEDQRTLTFGASDDARWIDFDVTIIASEGEVKFGDTKEGAFGIRVAGTMKVDAKMGGKIVNSEGQTDGNAWGKRAAWVDYHGPVKDQRVGIAILNHPSSFRHPTYWHVRTYGLFAANPFGLHNFLNSKDVDGSHTLKKGESFSLHHRVLLHKGNEKTAKIAESFAEYAKVQKDGS